MSSGYGADGFWFTLASGNNDEVDNWAAWDFQVAAGTYELQAWIPEQWATAIARYDVWVDSDGDGTFESSEYRGRSELDQAHLSGWQTLGQYMIDGAMLVEMQDSNAGDDWEIVGTVDARLAADAMRLRRVSN